MMRTDTLTNSNQVGNLYVIHCYFENNTAVRRNSTGDIIGKGIIIISFFEKIIYICLDIGNFYTSEDVNPWWKFINNDTDTLAYLTYFNHSLSRTIIGSGQNRNPGLYFIHGYATVSFLL
jgi:hypothetical protein